MKFVTFLLTLTFLVVYSLVGGAIFMLLERGTEEEFKSQANKSLHEIMADNSCLPEKELLGFQEIVARMSEGAVLMRQDSSTFYRSKFDLRSSIMVACFYFSGFGMRNMNPSTVGGKVFNVLYLLVAIYYVFFVTYATSKIFDVVLFSMFQRMLGRRMEVRKFVLVRQAILVGIALVFLILIPAAIIHKIEPWNFLESMYFCVVYLITLGFSDYIPGNIATERSENFIQWYRLCVGFWVLFATLWIGVILIQYSWLIGFFFWETTDMAVRDNIENIEKNLKKRSKAKSIKDFIAARKEIWRMRRQRKEIKDFPPPPDQPMEPSLYGPEFLQATTTRKFESSPTTPPSDRKNVISVTETTPRDGAILSPLSSTTYPPISNLDGSHSSPNSLQHCKGIVTKINV